MALLVFSGALSACGTGFEEIDSSSDVSVNVGSGQIDVAVGATFSATFSAKVQIATVTSETFFIVPGASATPSLHAKATVASDQCNPANAVPATVGCASDGLSCTLTPDGLLDVATSYILCLTSRIQFAQPQFTGVFEGVSHAFTSQAGPVIADDQNEVAIDATFEHVFDPAIDTTTVTGSTFFVVPTTVQVVLNTENLSSVCLAANALDGTLQCADDGLSCTLTLDASLQYAAWYLLCLTDDISVYAGSARAYKTQSVEKYSVGGTVNGLSGAVVLQNNAGDELRLHADGAFTFPGTLASEAAYAVTVKTQPASQTCTVSSGSGTISSANITDVSVSCAKNAYTVGGTVSGLSGTVSVENTSGDPLSLTANGSFTFSTAVAVGGTYSVTVATQPSEQTCTVSSGSGTISSANVTSVSVICSTDIFVTDVTSSTADGSYAASSAISIQVNFSGAATVTGTPTLTLETGTTDRTINYVSGSGTTALTFTYTVQSGDTAADLDYTSASALSLNGGTIKDGSGNAALLTLPTVGGSDALAGTSAIVIDTTGPTAGNSGTLTAGSVTSASMTVSWTAATDGVTAQASLQYLLYTSASANLSSVANIEANGTAQGAFAANITSKALSSLTGSTTYHYNVIVKDAVGNKTAYTAGSQATTATAKKIYLTSVKFGGNLGGISGADTNCQGDANYPGSGTYKAMLVDGTNRIACTVADCGEGSVSTDWVLAASTPYTRTDGTAIGTTTAGGVFTFSLTNAVQTDIAAFTHTGLNANWTSSGNDCSDWGNNSGTETVGDSTATDSSAIRDNLWACATEYLYCVEQ